MEFKSRSGVVVPHKVGESRTGAERKGRAEPWTVRESVGVDEKKRSDQLREIL